MVKHGRSSTPGARSLGKPCLIHVGTKSGNYPHIYTKGKVRRLNRVILEQKLGRPIKPGYCALHHCDIRTCIEPTHIYEGTKRQNTQDMMRRGRWRGAPGEKHPRACLTVAKVLMIRASKETTTALAKRLGVQFSAVAKARRGDTWGHV